MGFPLFMIKTMTWKRNQLRIKVRIFLDLNTKRICSKSHVHSLPNCLNKSLMRIYFHSLTSPVSVSKLQLVRPSQQSFSIHLADAIVSIVRRSIASALEMGENAPKGVFASTATTNLLSLAWKWMWSNFGKSHTCSATSWGNVEELIF